MNRWGLSCAALVTVGCLLAGCGSSSSGSRSTSTTTTAARTGATSSHPSAQVQREIKKARQRREKRDVAVRECLQKGGISPVTKLGIQVSSQPPKGMTHAQYEAFVSKCGAHIENPVLRQALAKFAACMRENGVNYPAPGTGAALGAKRLDTTSSTYKKALAKCRSVLSNAFRAGARTGGAGGKSAQPEANRTGRASLGPVRKCLQESGISVASQFELGDGHLPKGVTDAQYRAALKKCDGIITQHNNRPGNATFRSSLQKFTACMRANGQKEFPEPDTTGEGPIFPPFTVKEKESPQFKAAETKCNHVLKGSI